MRGNHDFPAISAYFTKVPSLFQSTTNNVWGNKKHIHMRFTIRANGENAATPSIYTPLIRITLIALFGRESDPILCSRKTEKAFKISFYWMMRHPAARSGSAFLYFISFVSFPSVIVT